MSYVHPVMPLLLWIPIITALSWVGLSYHHLNAFFFAFLFSAGFIVWTFTEYLLHRYMFHFVAESKVGKRFIFLLHGIHHDDPDDQRRLLMPPVPAILLASSLYLFFSIFLGFTLTNPFFAGFMVGYLCYDYIHFLTHFARFRSGVLKTLQQNHMNHHFRSDGVMFGVSSPLWDYVFKTKN